MPFPQPEPSETPTGPAQDVNEGVPVAATGLGVEATDTGIVVLRLSADGVVVAAELAPWQAEDVAVELARSARQARAAAEVLADIAEDLADIADPAGA